jgi:hypothetical protein
VELRKTMQRSRQPDCGGGLCLQVIVFETVNLGVAGGCVPIARCGRADVLDDPTNVGVRLRYSAEIQRVDE